MEHVRHVDDISSETRGRIMWNRHDRWITYGRKFYNLSAAFWVRVSRSSTDRKTRLVRRILRVLGFRGPGVVYTRPSTAEDYLFEPIKDHRISFKTAIPNWNSKRNLVSMRIALFGFVVRKNFDWLIFGILLDVSMITTQNKYA